MLTLWFDGLYRCIPGCGSECTNHQPGFMCYGWLITRRGKAIAQGHGTFARGKNANSVLAEYLALIEGLAALLDLDMGEDERVEIRGDAKSAIDQMRGVAEVSAQSVKPLYRKAKKLAARLKHIDWVWVPRRNNRAADVLSRRAMRQFQHDRVAYQTAVDTLQGKGRAGRQANRLLSMASICIYL